MTTDPHPGRRMNTEGQPMDSTPRQILPEVAGPVRPGTHRVRPSGRRRRPSGEAPPLPHHLQTSGVGWLVAALVLVVLAIAVFARGLQLDPRQAR